MNRRPVANPPLRHRRPRIAPALLSAAMLLGSSGISVTEAWVGRLAAQEAEIKQVVGKQLTAPTRSSGAFSQPRSSGGGLFSGLFGGGGSSQPRSSSGDHDEYRKVTPITDQRPPADWSGIPYHTPGKAAPTATAKTNSAPIRDPRAGQSSSSSTASTVPRPTTSSTVPITQPRPIGTATSSVPKPPPVAGSAPSSSSLSTSVPAPQVGSRPEPLSASRSSRRETEGAPDPTPTSPRLLSIGEAAPERGTDVVELVPKVSRRILKVENEPATTAAAPKPNTPSVAKSGAPESSRRVAPPMTPTPATTSPAKVAATPAPAAIAPKAVVATTPQAEPAVAAMTPPTNPTPVATKPAPTLAAPAPDAPAIVASTPNGATLGEARQSPATAMSAGPASQSVSSRNVAAAPTAPSAGDDVAANGQTSRLSTFGGNRPDSRTVGSLTANSPTGANATSVPLQPISDRLPFENPSQAGTPQEAGPDSMEVSSDTFGPRTTLASGPTSPTTNNAAFGRFDTANGGGYAVGSGSGMGMPATGSGLGTMPNAMRAGQVATGAAVSASATGGPAEFATSVAGELPGIRIVTAGPRQIMIRQTHGFEIRAENRGSIVAEGLVVRSHIPDWADVVGQQVTAGDVKSVSEGGTRNLNWTIDRLGAGETQRMFVRLKASRSGSHDLDVDWTLAPQKDVMKVFVQEPQLALTIDGPDEVVYGDSKTYRIRVLNPGDGIAPNVVFTLSPESSTPQSQKIGDIPAGKEAQFEVELTAQDLGQLKIHGLAVGDLELTAQADKTVRVLAADLEAVLTGPEIKYQNTEGVYQLELANRGTATSEDVMATLQLPVGVTYVGGMEGASLTDNELRWKIAALSPGARRDYQFRVQMNSTGRQEFQFNCKGSAAGQTAVALMTDVEAIADLVLSVEDPSAPAPIGVDVTYQIVIRNRGSKPATDVRAVAQFSNGIEPQQIVGHAGQVITGQVLIDPIPRIEPNQEVRMTIVARAQEGGHHRFRTEVRSGDTVLVAEEATHYMTANNERISRRSGPGGNEFSLPLR